jgi:hypothetical protein
LWDGKQAGHALKGLANAAHCLPSRHAELLSIGTHYSDSDRPVVAKTAKALLKAIET